MTGQTIYDRAGRILADSGHVRWVEAEMLGWINAGQQAIVALRPNALTAVALQTTVAGTKQTFDQFTLHNRLLEVVRNMGTLGNSPGKAIDLIDKKVMDAVLPDWHNPMYAADEVKAYMYDPKYPNTFYIWPPAIGGTDWIIELLVSTKPATVSSMATTLDLPDIYVDILLDYVLYRAFAKDTTSQINIQRATEYHQKFLGALSLMNQVDGFFDPDMKDEKPQAGG